MAKPGSQEAHSWEISGPLTDRLVKALTPPAKGNRIRWDGNIPGFGLRVTSAGAKAFILRYRNADGRDRTLTIGDPGSWKVAEAAERAKALKRRVDVDEDPLAERQARLGAATVNDLADRFEAEHLPRLRPVTARDYRALLKQHIRPALGTLKVAAISFHDFDRLHQKIAAKTPYVANRVLAVASKMFSMAMKWQMRQDNPTRSVERSPEHRRERFLSPAEIIRLGEVLAGHPERASARAVQLLLLTGARRSEVLGAKWPEFDLDAGIWLKPRSNTKSGRDHRIPLSAPALQLLVEMKAEADKENTRRSRDGLASLVYVFPGKANQPLREIKHFWASICDKAELKAVRLHDLRHTHASILASMGMSLPLIGALLGHTQPQTTQRYAHLMDDPLRAATERLGQIVTGSGKPSGKVVQLRKQS